MMWYKDEYESLGQKIDTISALSYNERVLLLDMVRLAKHAAPERLADGLYWLIQDDGSTLFIARDGKVGSTLTPDNTLRSPVDPAIFNGKWQRYTIDDELQ